MDRFSPVRSLVALIASVTLTVLCVAQTASIPLGMPSAGSSSADAAI